MNSNYTLFNSLMNETTKCIAGFLENIMPAICEKWWDTMVIEKLSFHNRKILKRNVAAHSLKCLDIATLIKILDLNWYEISKKLELTNEARHFVKEMQTVRNRWAHMNSYGVSFDDMYRDLDTLERFAGVINADQNLIGKINNAKRNLLNIKNWRDITEETSSSNMGFSPGQIVFLKSNPAIKGAIVSILEGKPENRCKVFVDGTVQTFYSSQLEVEIQTDNNYKIVFYDEFHSFLTAIQIRYPGLSTLYSLNAARIDYIPYQYRPVLKFIHSDRPRLLIADGVGVGKTIEAGLILREMQARRNVQSILIICPRPLVVEKKWQNEMKRFDERFMQMNSSDLRDCIKETDLDGVWPEQYQKAILPYSLFDDIIVNGCEKESKRKSRKGLLDLDPPPKFDLVIVDEAHHIRNQNTFSYKAVKLFCDNAEAVVFLTATPVQLGSNDLFVLLNALRPDLVIDKESFIHMSEPNPYINKAVDIARLQENDWKINVKEALDKVVSTAWGRAVLKNNPEFIRVKNKINNGNITDEERIKLITELESFHTFSNIINRTRRRDIGNFTLRKPETVVVEFTPAQKILYEEVFNLQASIYTQLFSNINVRFFMTMICRQMASCIFGLVPFLEDILKRHIDELLWNDINNKDDIVEEILSGMNMSDLEIQIQHIIDIANNIDKIDPKLDALKKIIQDKQKLQNNKVMVFSSFRHTLNYLYENLNSDYFSLGLIHGGTPDEERLLQSSRFELSSENEDALDVLLFSEIGCEGLDFQFCDCIVNYDLPWNPMRVEQRIGRIDRNGQKSESVSIFNLITPGTIDADIYERCLMRIGVFNAAIGGSEEILGEITRGIQDIANKFELTEEERKIKLQQLADNKVRFVQEQEALEQKQFDLFGIRLPESQIKKQIDDATSFWLSPESLQNFINMYLKRRLGKGQEYILGEKPLKTLRLSQEARNELLKDYRSLQGQKSYIYRGWENWLKGSNPHINITFESDCASDNRDAVMIIPIHPLVKQAALSLRNDQRIVAVLKVNEYNVPIGKYPFIIYQWQFYGIRENLILKPISICDDITPKLVYLLKNAFDVPYDLTDFNEVIWEGLEDKHHKLWVEAREEHRIKTYELANYRLESLKISHHSRMTLLNEQLSSANNEKIIKMRKSQISSASADFERRKQELDIAKERADVIAEPVAYGILIVEVL